MDKSFLVIAHTVAYFTFKGNISSIFIRANSSEPIGAHTMMSKLVSDINSLSLVLLD